MRLRPLLPAVAAAITCTLPVQAAESGYLAPPEPLLTVMRAPPTPSAMLDPGGRTLLQLHMAAYPGIERVAEPYLKLGGVRIEPRTHARHDRSSGYGIRTCVDGYTLVDVASGVQRTVALPKDGCAGVPTWSPDGKRFAFDNTTASQVELWVGDVASASVRRIEDVQLNTILGNGLNWVGGSERLLVTAVPAGLGPAPRLSAAAAGPKLSEAIAGKGESSTYEARDTLGNPHEEALFDHYVKSRLVRVDLPSGKATPLGSAGPVASVDVAPDGRHVLVQTLKRPYSYVTTYTRFARDVEVLDLSTGKSVRVAQLPVADRVPVRGVPTGPREHAWLGGEPATLVWAEALDQGDWKTEVPQRDKVMRLGAPFTGQADELARTEQRFAGIAMLEDSTQALLTQFDANRRWIRITQMDLAAPSKPGTVRWDYSLDERYRNPGTPVFKVTPDGGWVLRRDGDAIYLRGNGSTPEGDRPFLDRFDLASGATTRVFRSDATAFERVAGFSADGRGIITVRETPLDPPNVFERRLGDALAGAAPGEAAIASTSRQVTRNVDPTPQVRNVGRRLVSYKRKDGVDLSFTLYTPPGHVEGTRLPAILYAYPADYADPSMAGQVSGSQQSFNRFPNYRLLLLAGYAIIDNAAFPIVGDPRTAYDTYLQQLVDNAQSAVDKAVELGVVDRERIGVTGHSHGALMAANLLAHSDLFRAGVATSGGYNKTLTPFGFQNERRSFWSAPKVYDEASAYYHADKIDEPLLIMHGEDDANPGTEPVQSPKLFQAIRGNGGTTRLVMLPYEPHWYTARESNEHVAAEMLAWFDRWVKNAPARPQR